ncbi:MAG TPA: TetR/AcrR family transcriptional regulator [Planctomycetota bacterium]|nr:TetR/AcrR family transcriptional regulator [Planctomycetota bacterium]
MARPKEFDVDEALARATDTFWQRGYAATSMQHLVDVMGIQKASLYGTFGDKHSLYLAALRSYQQQALADLEKSLLGPGSARTALRDLLSGLAGQVCGAKGKRGCLCVNANVELAPQDADVAELLRAHSECVEAVFERTLQRAKAEGDLPKGADCKQLATFLFGIVVALNVLGKQRAGRTRLQALANQALAALHM